MCDQWAKDRAELAVSNAECGAQLEIADAELRDSLVRNITLALQEAIDRDKATNPAPPRSHPMSEITDEMVEKGARAALDAMRQQTDAPYTSDDIDDDGFAIVDGCVDFKALVRTVLSAAMPMVVERCGEERLNAVLTEQEQKLRRYIAESCDGDDDITKHARAIAQGRLVEIDVLRCSLTAAIRARKQGNTR